MFIGELALDGKVRPVNGVLSIALLAKKEGLTRLFVPKENAEEAALVKELEVIPIESLVQTIAHLEGRFIVQPQAPTKIEELTKGDSPLIDMAYIKGQETAKRAIEIAASGTHNLLMSGPPGSGKSLLAKAIPSILPKMTRAEILEVTKIHSVAGKLGSKTLQNANNQPASLSSSSSYCFQAKLNWRRRLFKTRRHQFVSPGRAIFRRISRISPGSSRKPASTPGRWSSNCCPSQRDLYLSG